MDFGAMMYVVTILLLLAIVLTSEMGRELLISHVGQMFDMAPWVIMFGGVVILLLVALT
jgi:hypothetical protein